MYRIFPDFGITPKFSLKSISSLKYYTSELEKDEKKKCEDYWTMKIFFNEGGTYNYVKLEEWKSVSYLLSSKKINFDRAMYGAARGGCQGIIEHLISLKVRLLSNDVMRIAAEEGHLEIVEYLVFLGASDFNDAMYLAAKEDHINLVKYFISLGATDFNEAMYGAARGGHREMVKYLISLGANNFKEAIESAAGWGHQELAEYLKTFLSGL
jgi:hypothetical protein